MSAPPARAALGLFVVAAYGLIGASLFGVAVPLSLLVATLLGVTTFVTVGVFFLNLGVFVDVTSRGSTRRSVVALTFDDGPHPVHTRQVLATLAERGHKATFFVVGEKVAAHPDVAREIAEAGHELGLHGYDHDRLLNLRHEPRIIRDLDKTADAIATACGQRPRLFRPPVGFTSPRTRVAVRARDLEVVGWTARGFDGAGRPSVAALVERLTRSLSPGAILLLHDAPERGEVAPTSVEALPSLLAELETRGFSSVTVTELLHSAAAPLAPKSERPAESAIC